jgi:glycosyltransferase involved in cell wall biosynthesis
MTITARLAGTAVVIPCYNQARFLGEAIESALTQTRAAAELVVVDDGSTEDVANVVARYPSARYIRQRNSGPSAARNAGMRATSSEFVLFLDGDDRLLPEAIAAGEDRLRARPECAFAAGRMSTISADGALLQSCQPYPEYDDPYAAMLVDHCSIYPVTTIYRRSALETVNGFDVSFRRAEDWELDLRLAERFAFDLHQQPVGERRRHGGNISSDAGAMLASIVRLLRSKRSVTRGHAAREAARVQGIRRARTIYVEPVITRIHELLAGGQLREATGLAAALLYSHPRILLERAALKVEWLRTHWSGSHEAAVEQSSCREPGEP